MFRRVSCPGDTYYVAACIYLIREFYKDEGMKAEVTGRFFPETNDYPDGFSVAIDAGASREEVLVAKAISMTVIEKLWYDDATLDVSEIERELDEALEGGKEPNDG